MHTQFIVYCDAMNVERVHSTRALAEAPCPCGWLHTVEQHLPLVGETTTAPLGSTFITVFAIDRRYGGPEEGGWWYETGEVELVRAVPPGEDVDAHLAALQAVFPNTGRASSVRGGPDYRIEIDTKPGENYPATRPHYC